MIMLYVCCALYVLRSILLSYYVHVAMTPLAPCIAEHVGLNHPTLFLSAIDGSYPIVSLIGKILEQQPLAMRQRLLADRAFCKCIIEITDAAVDRGVQQLHNGDHFAVHQRILVAGKLRVLNDVPAAELPLLGTWLRMREGDGVRETGLENTQRRIRAYLLRIAKAAVQEAASGRLNNIIHSYVNPP